MKIIAGDFGINGSCWISRDKKLVIEGMIKKAYSPDQIDRISSRIEKNKKFGFIGFIVGTLILSLILGFFLNIIGVIMAIAIGIIGSFYTEKINLLDISLADGKQITLECTNWGASAIYKLKYKK